MFISPPQCQQLQAEEWWSKFEEHLSNVMLVYPEASVIISMGVEVADISGSSTGAITRWQQTVAPGDLPMGPDIPAWCIKEKRNDRGPKTLSIDFHSSWKFMPYIAFRHCGKLQLNSEWAWILFLWCKASWSAQAPVHCNGWNQMAWSAGAWSDGKGCMYKGWEWGVCTNRAK